MHDTTGSTQPFYERHRTEHLSSALHCSGFVASQGAFCDVLWSGSAGNTGTNASWAAFPLCIWGETSYGCYRNKHFAPYTECFKRAGALLKPALGRGHRLPCTEPLRAARRGRVFSSTMQRRKKSSVMLAPWGFYLRCPKRSTVC